MKLAKKRCTWHNSHGMNKIIENNTYWLKGNKIFMDSNIRKYNEDTIEEMIITCMIEAGIIIPDNYYEPDEFEVESLALMTYVINLEEKLGFELPDELLVEKFLLSIKDITRYVMNHIELQETSEKNGKWE